MPELEFKQYSRKGLSEMRPFAEGDETSKEISFSSEDLKLKTLVGGFIARNPKNYADQWYVAKKYFDDNLQEVVIEEEVEQAPKEVVDEDDYIQRRMDWSGDGFLLIAEDEGVEDPSPGCSSEYWNLSTRAMQIYGIGCVIKTSTIVNGNVSEALVFVPGTKIYETKNEDGYVVSRKIVIF